MPMESISQKWSDRHHPAILRVARRRGRLCFDFALITFQSGDEMELRHIAPQHAACRSQTGKTAIPDSGRGGLSVAWLSIVGGVTLVLGCSRDPEIEPTQPIAGQTVPPAAQSPSTAGHQASATAQTPSATERLPTEAEHLAEAERNLTRIGQALKSYRDAEKRFPPAGVKYAESPEEPVWRGLSWRVRILPYLGEQDLYAKFDFNQPWDSPQNLALVAEMPDVFRMPRGERTEFKTTYLGVVYADSIEELEFREEQLKDVLQGTMFDSIYWFAKEGPASDGESPRFRARHKAGLTTVDYRDILDGTANTIMVVEAKPEEATTWTQPDEWEFDLREPRNGLAAFRSNGYLALFADHTIRVIPESVDDETLRRLFVRADGLPINGAALRGPVAPDVGRDFTELLQSTKKALDDATKANPSGNPAAGDREIERGSATLDVKMLPSGAFQVGKDSETPRDQLGDVISRKAEHNPIVRILVEYDATCGSVLDVISECRACKLQHVVLVADGDHPIDSRLPNAGGPNDTSPPLPRVVISANGRGLGGMPGITVGDREFETYDELNAYLGRVAGDDRDDSKSAEARIELSCDAALPYSEMIGAYRAIRYRWDDPSRLLFAHVVLMPPKPIVSPEADAIGIEPLQLPTDAFDRLD
jgi:hypothetical protein